MRVRILTGSVVLLVGGGALGCSQGTAAQGNAISRGATDGGPADSDKTTADGAASPADAPDVGSGAPLSFERDIFPIFQKSCATGGVSCHGDPSVVTNGPGGNREYLAPPVGTIDAATILAGLVGVPSVEDPSLPVVKAGDPTMSYLMHKMDDTLTGLQCPGSSGCGLLMPFGAATLPQATRDIVRAWIAQGARSDMQVDAGLYPVVDAHVAEDASPDPRPDASVSSADSGAKAPAPTVNGAPEVFDAGAPISGDAGPLAGRCTAEGTCNGKPWYVCESPYTADADVVASYYSYAGVGYGCTLDQTQAAACTSGSTDAVDCCLTLSAAALGKALAALGCTP